MEKFAITYEDVDQNEDYYRNLLFIIKDHLINVSHKKLETKLKQEKNVYKNEEELENAIYNINNWIECLHDNFSDRIQIDDVKCDIDDCWFQGNLDRINEYTSSYRFKGTYIYICSVCFLNDLYKNDNILKLIKDKVIIENKDSDDEVDIYKKRNKL